MVVLGVGLGLFELTRQAVLHTGNPRLLPAMALVGALVVPVAVMTLVWGLGPAFDVSPVLALLVGLVGGGLSLVLAGQLESAVLARDGTVPALAIAAAEEVMKLAVPVLLLAWCVPARAMNGLVLGAAAGAGFAILETLGYAFVAYAGPGGLDGLDADLLYRSLVAPATHLAWTGAVVCAIGYAGSRAWSPLPAAVVVASLAAAVGLHAAWDTWSGPLPRALLALADLLLLAVCLERCRRRPESEGRRV